VECALALVLVIALAMPALAHHSVLPFDGEHATILEGTVTKFVWQNPHTIIEVDVKDSRGGMQHWRIESEAPGLLTRLGWSKDLLKAGDRITTIGARAKSGDYFMRCQKITLSENRTLPCFPN
jgi:hypothetical protein